MTREEKLILDYLDVLAEMREKELREYKERISKDISGNEELSRFYDEVFSVVESRANRGSDSDGMDSEKVK